jgi:hypothetical protein
MVILNYFCGARNWQIETVRTIDRRMPPRDELESIQRGRCIQLRTRFLILCRNRSIMRERIIASQLG